MDAAITAVLERDPRVAYGVLFGSQARGSSHVHSDVDVAIGLEPGAELGGLEVGRLVVDLEAAAGRTVDLVIVDEAPCSLTYRVFRDGRVLFERDHARLVEDKSRAILEYLDFRWVEDVFTKAVLQRARRSRS